jgi:hypothetical protein
MPYMLKLYEKYQPKIDQSQGGLELFGIALDQRGSIVAKPFFQKIKMTYPMLVDPTTGPDAGGLIRAAKEMADK